MHPFYEPNRKALQSSDKSWLGLASMAMYLLFWAGALGVAARFAKENFPAVKEGCPQPDPAVGILRERYAKGEINAEEFKRRRADLRE